MNQCHNLLGMYYMLSHVIYCRTGWYFFHVVTEKWLSFHTWIAAWCCLLKGAGKERQMPINGHRAAGASVGTGQWWHPFLRCKSPWGDILFLSSLLRSFKAFCPWKLWHRMHFGPHHSSKKTISVNLPEVSFLETHPIEFVSVFLGAQELWSMEKKQTWKWTDYIVSLTWHYEIS